MSLQKFHYVRSEAIRKSAEGETCSLRSPVCNGRTDTTVWAHSNFGAHGKGKSIKSSDIFGFYACSACHAWFDGAMKRGIVVEDVPGGLYPMWVRANAESIGKLIDKGIIKVEA